MKRSLSDNNLDMEDNLSDGDSNAIIGGINNIVGNLGNNNNRGQKRNRKEETIRLLIPSRVSE